MSTKWRLFFISFWSGVFVMACCEGVRVAGKVQNKVKVPPYVKNSNGNLYYFNATKSTWHEAMDTCSKDGGYVMDESVSDHVLKEIRAENSEDYLWVALHKINGYFQWVGKYAEYKRDNKWNWHLNEKNLVNGGPCAKLMLPKTRVSPPFLLTEYCEIKLPFACLFERDDLNLIDTTQLALKLTARKNSKVLPNVNHLRLNLEDFQNLTLRCDCTAKSQINWVKDGIYLVHRAKVLQPTTVYDLTRTLSSPGTFFSRQGSYWCEVWVPGQTERIVSNKILVELSDVLNVIVHTSHFQEASPPYDSGNLVPEKMTEQMKFKGLDLTSSSEWDQGPSEYREYGKGIKITHRFYLYINLTLSNATEKLLQWATSDFFANYIFGKLNYLNDSKLYFPTMCLTESKGVFTWHATQDGTTAVPQDGLCITLENHVVSRKCRWNFPGAEWSEFDPSLCHHYHEFDTELDKCPSGFSISNDVCKKFTADDTWENAYSSCMQTGLEVSPLKSVSEMRKVSSIWLPFKRQWPGGPLSYIGVQQTSVNFQDHSYTTEHNVTWAEGEPKRSEDCLTMNFVNRTLATKTCDEKLPYLCILPLIQERNRVGRFGCPQDWVSHTLIPRRNTCYNKMTTGDGDVSWDEANDMCRKENATLVNFDSAYMQKLVLEALVPSLDIRLPIWIDIVNRNGTMYNSFGIMPAEKIAWDSHVDLSQQFGVFGKTGFIYLKDTNHIRDVICQKMPTPSPSWMQLSLSEKELQVSGSVDLLNSYHCYHNGLAFYHCNGNCLTQIPLHDQGYYQCESFSTVSLEHRSSNTVLYRDKDIFTYSVSTLDESKTYSPENHDFTFKSNDEISPYLQDMTDFVQKELAPEIHAKVNVIIMNISQHMAAGLRLDLHLEVDAYQQKSNWYQRAAFEQHLLELLKDKILPVGRKVRNMTVLSVKSTSTCPDEAVNLNGTSLTIPVTSVGKYTVSNEPCIDSSGNPVLFICRDDFNSGASWDLGNKHCDGSPNKITLGLWKLRQSSEIDSATKLTSDPDVIQPIDIHYATKLLENLPSRHLLQNEMSCALDIVNNLVQVDYHKLVASQELLNTSNRIIGAVEAIMLSGKLLASDHHDAEGNTNYKSEREMVSFEVWDLKTPAVVGFSSNLDGRITKINTLYKDNVHLHDDTNAALILPNELVDNITSLSIEKTVRLSFVVYNNSTLFDTVGKAGNKGDLVVNSPVIQASIKDTQVHEISPPVKILFKPRRRVKDPPLCVYWDFFANEGAGKWSPDGCWYDGQQDGKDVCYCNHLTSFAELVSFYGQEGEDDINEDDRLALDIITLIGCTVSIVGLCLVFTTFFLFPRWRKPLGNRIVVNLSFALFVVYVVFLAGIHQTWNGILCIVVSSALHYFILATFCWMFIEALHQYLRFVKVVGTYIPRFMWKAALGAWGCPIVPVVCVLAYDPNLYLGGDAYCWMSTTVFLYAFLVPLFLILTVNTTIFCLIIYNIFCQRTKLRSNQQQYQLAVTQVRMAVCVFVLLGLTWLFGAFAIGGARIIFTYLFCIFNTFQGFLIFAFHVLHERTSTNLWTAFLSVCGCRNHPHDQMLFNSRLSSAPDQLFKTDGRYIPVLPRQTESMLMASRKSALP